MCNISPPKLPTWFCPLLKDTCNPKCVAYREQHTLDGKTYAAYCVHFGTKERK